MKIERVWAMPNKHTFLIKPIAELLREEIVGDVWVDPFAGWNSPANLTNDLNPEAPTDYHKEAADFLESLPVEFADGVLFDPPYSLTQIKECYSGFGIIAYSGYSTEFPTREKDAAAKLVRPGGKALCFGWSSGGLGKKRGFELKKILLVPHGGKHNDTIVTVERKVS